MELTQTSLTALTPSPNKQYFTTEYKTLIEDHLTILISKSTSRTIENYKATQFKNNFYGLLKSLGVKPTYWWVLLRLNELETPLDYTGEFAIRYLEPSVLDRFNQQFRTVSGELF